MNDAGNQFRALAASFDVRLRQALGEPAELPENGYPGEYLVDLAREYVERDPAAAREALALPDDERLTRLGWYAVHALVAGQRRVLDEYGTVFHQWSHEQADVRAKGLPERAIAALTAAGHTYEDEGALWFRSTAFGDDKDRVPAEVGRRPHLLRGGHRLPPLLEVRATSTASSTSSAPTTTATSRGSRRRCGPSAIPTTPSTCSSCSSSRSCATGSR